MSFDPAPCVTARPQRNLQHSRSEHLSGNVLRRRMPGTSGVMMGPNHRAVHTQRPLTDTVHGVITADPQRIEHRPPGAITRPAAVSVVDRLPIPVTGRKITPRRARPSPPHHPVHDQAVIHPPAAPDRRPIRKQRLQNQPIRITQVMTGMHHKCLADPNPYIHGTRPSPTDLTPTGSAAPFIHLNECQPPGWFAPRRLNTPAGSVDLKDERHRLLVRSD